LALENTNQSLLSTKINEIMKILTIFSVITFPLTLLASVWGMNVVVPFQDSPKGFLVILLIMTALMGFMFLFFYKRKWL
ncbi:magnesium transporter CorA, partial [Patescibacteria group bacterium]|nr:magnesium transporter CorA [Patescibacteria group bacterium]